MAEIDDIKFCHAQGHKGIIPAWEGLFNAASHGLQVAVCYVTAPGIAVLSGAISKFQHRDSFFVTSVEYPTNIDALADLHSAIPGKVHIHLGYLTPRTNDETQQDGFSLMHSKVLLAQGGTKNMLWVGSHNLTARAMSGANLEAGVLITAGDQNPVILDARAHLAVCRATAEVFDPARIEIYKAIQRRRMEPPLVVETTQVLVIHAEADESVLARTEPMNVHLCLVPHQLDSYFAIDRDVRLFLYPRNSLQLGRPAPAGLAVAWKGRQTAIARTARHPRNRGITGNFPHASFQVFVQDLLHPPITAPTGQLLPDMTTQIMIRVDGRAPVGQETYPTKYGARGLEMITTVDQVDADKVDRRLLSAFHAESVKGGDLIFQRVEDIVPMITVYSYPETVQHLRAIGPADAKLKYEDAKAKNPIDPYFFVSKGIVRLE